MIKVSILNFLPYMKNWEDHIGIVENKTPEEAANIIRDSCKERAKDFEEWSRLIRDNCVIPKEHPYRTLLENKNIPNDHPLWTLGSIAFGTSTDWIIIQRIKWDDITTSFPEKGHKEFLKKYLKIWKITL